MCMLTCENHPDLRWSCKSIAISKDENGVGRYNGTRNIFFFGIKNPREGGLKYTELAEDGPNGTRLVRECDCPSSKLKYIGEYEEGV